MEGCRSPTAYAEEARKRDREEVINDRRVDANLILHLTC
jgi:hypothetical protein